MLLVNARLTGTEGAAKAPAVVNFNGGRIFLRDVKTTGFGRALADIATPDFAQAFRVKGPDRPGSEGPEIAEYCSHPATHAFPGAMESLRLPIKPVPPVPWEAPAQWAVVVSPGEKEDATAAIQRAMDSGAVTVFLPSVHYRTSATITVGPKVRRIVGVSGYFNYGHSDRPDFRIGPGTTPLTVENFSGLWGGIELASRRTVVFRSLELKTIHQTAAAEGAEVYIEDVVGDDFRFRKQQVWARQLNIENQGTHLTNDGGAVWVLGYKTERGGTLIHTLGGGSTEILGGFSYTTTAGKLAPMFINDASRVWAFFAETCYTGDPFATIIEETRAGETRRISREQGSALPYAGTGREK
jgi:hypothetical protein